MYNNQCCFFINTNCNNLADDTAILIKLVSVEELEERVLKLNKHCMFQNIWNQN